MTDKPNQQAMQAVAHFARETYLEAPGAPPLAHTLVLVLTSEIATMVVILDTSQPDFEPTIRHVFEKDAEYVLAYRDRDPGGLLRIVAQFPNGIARLRTPLVPGGAQA